MKDTPLTAKPDRLLVQRGADRYPLFHEIRKNLPGVPVSYFNEGEDPASSRGAWVLRGGPTRFVKPCPGTKNYLCCGYQVFSPVIGCPYTCSYCILPDYYGARGVTVFVNLEEALEEVRSYVNAYDGIVRIGTGEMADSLALDPYIPLSETLAPFFKELPDAILELKTKSVNVERLMDLDHGGRTVVSWSVNPPDVIARIEAAAPPLEARLHAARRCQQKGYPVGLHFDPMIRFDGWETHYRDLVDRIFEVLDPEGIIWISLGALRYPPSMHERLLPSGLGLGELVPGLDGKYRYLRPLREEMFARTAERIRRYSDDVFVYLCMESPDVWSQITDRVPEDMAEIDRRFQDRIRKFIA